MPDSSAAHRKPTEPLRQTRGPAAAGWTTPGRAASPSPALVLPVLTHAPKRRKTALLLCVFLGWMGAHRFYVGKKGTGRLYLWTGGLCFLGVIVDLVSLLTDTFLDGSGQPLG